jgi:GPH family glycoside/pentoside/hexuronide:cation symporter
MFPYASLLGVISSEPKERNTLSTYRMMFAYNGSFIALLLFMPMVNYFSEGYNAQRVGR